MSIFAGLAMHRAHRSRAWLVAVAAVLCGAGHVAIAESVPVAPIDEAFTRWARQHAHPVEHVALSARDTDLEPLRGMIGSATIVLFGEGLHGGAEPLEFRNRLFRFLVESLGFTSIAIESGITESFEVNRYVLGEEGDLAGVVAKGFTFGFDRLPQEAELVRWMREYNATPAHPRKIEFYGFDVPGTPTHVQGTLFDALDYLQARDPAATAALRARIADLVPLLNLDRGSDAPNQYTQLSQSQRDRLTAAIADLVAQFEIHETEYAHAASDRTFAIAYRSAIAARQVDDYLRQLPIGWKPKDGPLGLAGTIASADRTKADNLRWIAEQMGPNAKILVFAHRDHIATALSTLRLSPELSAWTLPPMMGMYLKRRYDKQLVTIGNLFASDQSSCGTTRMPAAPNSIEGRLASLPAPYLLLDLRQAPPDVGVWLRASRELYGVGPPNTTSVGNAYDIVFFSRLITPAVPCS